MDNNQANHSGPAIEELSVSAYTIPTETPESDGTLKWDSTTMVLVEVEAGDKLGIGYSYANQAAAHLVQNTLADEIKGLNAFDIPAVFRAMETTIRNQGRTGIAYMAISAVDVAMWDLKAKLFGVPVTALVGHLRDGMPIYGSGGFTSYSVEKLQEQLGRWSNEGIENVKMKTGRDPEQDVHRVKAARDAIGSHTGLLVDANGAYSAKEATWFAEHFAEFDVTWFEEPVASDNLDDLHHIRQNVPAGMEVTAGEYGYNLSYFKTMLEAEAVDVLQADATRCGGITGFLKAGTVAESFLTPFSSHCAPAIHLHAGPALKTFRHAEYFYDHVRIENMLFDGVQQPEEGVIKPDLSRPGLGLEFKQEDAKQYKVL